MALFFLYGKNRIKKPKAKKRSKTLKKLLANFKKVSIMHFRCHARQQRKNSKRV